MANTVAYNNGSNPVGSIKKGVVSINIDNSLITSGLTWRNGIEFTNQYIIYSDTYTQGIDTQQNAKPCAWSCAYNDTALRDLINSLPPLIGQPKYNTLSEAITWLEGQNKYFLVNQNYPEIVTSGMTLCLDAGMSGSYPNVGTNWYNLNGDSGKNGTLLNGLTWNNSETNSFFSFDGTNDYINIPGSITWSLSGTSTVNVLCNPTSGYGWIVAFDKGGWNGWYIRVDSFLYNGQAGYDQVLATNGSYNIWQLFTIVVDRENLLFKTYKNGVFVTQTAITQPPITYANNLYFGSRGGVPDNFYYGKTASVQFYNRVLSESEILQNYYKGRLVTSGLTLALDAGNLVSYGGVGTTWYDMTSNGNNGTLTNGPTYSGGTVPSLIFDGSDDYVSLANNQLPNNFTYSIWVMRDGDGNQGGRGIVISNGSTYIDVNFSNKILFSLILSNGVQNLIQSANGVVAPVGVWAYYAATYNKQQAKLYYNGVEVASSNYTLDVGGYGTTFTIGKYDGGSYNLNGKISNAQVYNRALTPAEITQNFNTYRRRFGI